MDILKNFADIVSAFGILVVAGIVAYIASRQQRVDESKLKLSLYDRRLQVFEAGMAFIVHVVQHGDATDQALAAVNRAQLEGVFLFPQSVADYMAMLYDKGVALRCANEALYGKNRGAEDEQAETTREQADLLEWFDRQKMEFQSQLRPFMGFGSMGE